MNECVFKAIIGLFKNQRLAEIALLPLIFEKRFQTPWCEQTPSEHRSTPQALRAFIKVFSQ